ncbi:MAG: NAD(P)/FAD-dependent oxidoreductase [Dehalococcoidia bacterium]
MSLPQSLADLHWLNAVPEPIVGDDAPLPARAEVVIVGGGYVGGATAYWLATRGIAAVLIERRGISAGATGRNAGFIAPGLGMLFSEAVERYGRGGALDRLNFTRRGRDLALALIDEIGIDCALERSGGLVLAASAEEWASLRASAVALRKAGVPVEVLSRHEIADHLLVPVPALFHGAIYNPETVLVNPALLNAGIIHAAHQRGARLYPHIDVLSLTDQPDGSIIVETTRGEVRAGYVVLATNAWTPLLAGFFKDRITPVRGQIFATAPAPPTFRRGMSTNYGYEYWSQRADGVIVLGGARWATPDRDEGYYADELNSAIQDALERFLTTTFPSLAGVRVARRWSGIMGFSRDGYPFIGSMPGRPHLIVAAGFTGHGGPYFAIAGRCVAELIAGGHSEMPIDNYALDRPL